MARRKQLIPIRKTLLSLAIAGLVAPASYAQSPSNTGFERAQRTDRVIVKLKENKAQASSLHAQSRLQIASAGMDMTLIRVDDQNEAIFKLNNVYDITEVEQYADALAASGDVEYAEPDYFAYPAAAVPTPDDTYYYKQWSLHHSGSGMNIDKAWEITTGNPDIVVAIVDSGITDHSEFDGRLIDGFDFITGDSVGGSSQYYTANDGDARDLDPYDNGDWVSSSENNGSEAQGFFQGCGKSNSSWHGTHVAGIVGAKPNNGSGIAGINWESKLWALRVLGKCGGYVSDIAAAVKFAAGQTQSGVPSTDIRADVINLSLSRRGTCSKTEQSAVDAAYNAGIPVVTAAGNNGDNSDSYAPGNCRNVINVGATGKHGGTASYSNLGQSVDISAPGGDFTGVISTLNSGKQEPETESYASYVGTSMAAGQVSGVISLMLSVNADLSPDEIEEILISTAQPLSSGECGFTEGAGSGIIDGHAAVLAAQSNVVPNGLACDSSFEAVAPIVSDDPDASDEETQDKSLPGEQETGDSGDQEDENIGNDDQPENPSDPDTNGESSGSVTLFTLLLLVLAMLGRGLFAKAKPVKLRVERQSVRRKSERRP